MFMNRVPKTTTWPMLEIRRKGVLIKNPLFKILAYIFPSTCILDLLAESNPYFVFLWKHFGTRLVLK